jgi:predicted RNase H-like nuclease
MSSGTAPPLVAGVDGCRGGWVAVIAGCHPQDDRPCEVAVVTSVAPLLARIERGELAALAIDMPIGLADSAPRRCDLEARRLLGRRRSSVFPAPVRATLGAADHAEAGRRSRAASGRSLSIQAFNLLPKVAELDRLLGPQHHDTVVEAHPELAFLRLAGGRALPPKRTPEGRARRVELVGPVLAGVAAVELARTAGAPLGDLLDAAALVATARRVVAGTAAVLGDGERDATGRPMRIAW